MAIESGSWAARLVYGAGSAMLSAELSYAEGTERGGPGENIASDIAVSGNAKAWYRANLMMTNLYAVDGTGGVLAHMQYDAWGKPLLEAHMDLNLSGLEQVASFASYSWDKTLGLWYAQARMYDAAIRRFTSEDPMRDGANWYAYCGNNPVNAVDLLGQWTTYSVLNYKDTKEEVKVLQRALQYLEYFTYGEITSYYGDVTLKAVQNYKYERVKKELGPYYAGYPLQYSSAVNKQVWQNLREDVLDKWSSRIVSGYFPLAICQDESELDSLFLSIIGYSTGMPVVNTADFSPSTEKVQKYANNIQASNQEGHQATLAAFATVLLNKGYDPMFVAGILGNVFYEGGRVGLFEKWHSGNGYLRKLREHHREYLTDFSNRTVMQVGVKKTYDITGAAEKERAEKAEELFRIMLE